MIDDDAFLDFVLVAAPRAGTTWLSDALREHPGLWVPPEKELNFFNAPFLNRYDYKYPQGLEAYRAMFRAAPPGRLLGDLTPTYYVDPAVASRLHRHFPNVRVLMQLRNPAEVVFSTYRKVREMEAREPTFERELERYPEYLELGRYHRYLRPYFECFPRERIQVQRYETLAADPARAAAAAYAFLGVEAGFRPSVLGRRVNEAGEVRSRSLLHAYTLARRTLNHPGMLRLKRGLLRTAPRLETAVNRLMRSNVRPAPRESLAISEEPPRGGPAPSDRL
jgi:hypothetical protein